MNTKAEKMVTTPELLSNDDVFGSKVRLSYDLVLHYPHVHVVAWYAYHLWLFPSSGIAGMVLNMMLPLCSVRYVLLL